MTKKPLVSEELVRSWLMEAVARYARVNVSLLTPETTFQDVGLSSMAAVMLSGELSDAFGIEVDPLLTWDYPTIAEAAHALCKGQAGVAPSEEVG